MEKTKTQKRISRHARVRAKIIGTAARPRVSVFRSNQHIFIQFIDDEARKTILSNKISGKGKKDGSKSDVATKLGSTLAEMAKKSGIDAIVFDRGGFRFHGRIKAFADGLRNGGIKF